MNRHRRPANELFPGLDWRYLLPDPAPGTVVAIGRGPLAAIAGRLTRRSSAFDPDGADLVVADRANRATLEWAHHLVRPGGSLYVEVPWPRWRQAEVLGRRLTAAGFPDPSLYSLSASRDRWSPSWWIPVGDADAARFVADSNQLQPEDRQSWLGRRRSHLIGWLSRRERLIERHPWLIHPTRRQTLAAVAVKPASDGGTRDSRPGLLAGATGRSDHRLAAVMRVGGSSTDQAMMFAIEAGGRPRVVIKAPTRPEEIEASRRESKMLARLSGRSEPLPGVPQPVAIPVDVGVDAWGQTFAGGRPLTRTLTPDNIEHHALTMTDWLVDLAQRTSSSRHDHHVRSVAGAVDRLGPVWDRLPDGTTLELLVRERLDGLVLQRQVCQHRDLGPWNVRTEGGSLQVIDWADAVTTGPPLCDLHHFLAHLALCAFDAYRPIRREAIIAAVTDERSDLGRLIGDCLDRYADAIDLEPAAIPPLRALTWLLDLLRRPEPERADSIYLELLRAELS